MIAALVYGLIALGFYTWIIKSAKEVPSPLAVWVNESEEVRIADVA